MDYNFNFGGMIIFLITIGFACWGLWELVDWLFIEDVIKSSEPITPELEIIVKDNIVDTLYVYRKP